MRRLTYKCPRGILVESSFEYDLLNGVCYQDCVDKLGQLEDIERELGIDLSVFLKACLDGIYVKSAEYGNQIFGPMHLQYIKDEKCFYNFVRDMNASWEEIYYLKDYGKTWALTKEELEK